MLAGKKLSRAPEAALHFVGNEQHTVVVTDVNQNAKEFFRRNYKSALAQHWLSNDGRNFFRRDHSLECVFKMRRTKYIARWVPQRVRATVAVCIRNAVHIAGERRKPRLVGMSLTSERQRHHGASVKGVFKRNDPGSTRVHSGNLHCVFYCLSTSVHEHSLLAEPPWRNLVHSFGEPHVTLIRRPLRAGVEIPIQLLPNRSNHSLTSMPDVDAANAAREVDIAIAIDVFEPGVLRLCYIYRSALREPPRHSVIAALGKRLRLGTRYCGLNLNRPQFSVPTDRRFVQVNVHLLGFEIFLDSPRPKLTPETGLLVAAPRRFDVSGLHVIHPNNAGF